MVKRFALPHLEFKQLICSLLYLLTVRKAAKMQHTFVNSFPAFSMFWLSVFYTAYKAVRLVRKETGQCFSPAEYRLRPYI